MKKLIGIIVVMLFFGSLQPVQSCINLDINIGVVDSSAGRLYAELLGTLIHERTGTKALIKYFDNDKELDEVLAKREVDIVIANPVVALNIIGLPVQSEPSQNFDAVKEYYQQKRNQIWLDPFGKEANGGTGQVMLAPVLSRGVLEKFPALPRVIGKLTGKVTLNIHNQLLGLIEKERQKPKQVAKDFLVEQRLI